MGEAALCVKVRRRISSIYKPQWLCLNSVKDANSARTFEATRKCFRNGRLTLAEKRPAPFQQCEAACSQISEQKRSLHWRMAGTAGCSKNFVSFGNDFSGRFSAPKPLESLRDASPLKMVI
ncbi:hypothetical protein TvY486_0045450 [Trypanosoma vivax Y486]|uniref:Uncharacterized protein n=1 Tax=Trypanosoma vivax (strain Y486) TaxID=1055687 RepID=F9WVL8_TRYVY|nr:hypothetical protein TvY486_0045450 [Trypanosoma vivax Y486]|eukprot:CCD21626.1 hypothetical protein TvY486_0045450 [Trypanosoma vivax Y486]